MYKIIRALYHRISLYLKISCEVLRIVLCRRGKMVFLFGVPNHSNMGDQAQTYCIKKWIYKNYPQYGIHTFSLQTSSDFFINLLRKFIKKDDKLICHSGYHMTDLYHEQDVYCKIIKLFPEYKIIVFPQTINYLDINNLKATADVFNKHGNILLMCRDKQSYAIAQQYFTNTHLLLFPDIVTSLIGTKSFSGVKHGILFCMRNDKEAYYKPEDIKMLRNRFSEITKTDITDTTIKIKAKEISKDREKILNDIFKYYAQFQVIITDRYHGTIFSLIAGTPVVVLSSTDHKLSSGVDWFPDSFSGYICFAKTLDEAYDKGCELLKKHNRDILPAYFRDNYYNKLKNILENGRVMS